MNQLNQRHDATRPAQHGQRGQPGTSNEGCGWTQHRRKPIPTFRLDLKNSHWCRTWLNQLNLTQLNRRCHTTSLARHGS